MIKKLFVILLASQLLVACSEQPKESDTLLSDYKQQQLDKAKQIEQEMQKRVDNLEQQLENATENQEDEPR